MQFITKGAAAAAWARYFCGPASLSGILPFSAYAFARYTHLFLLYKGISLVNARLGAFYCDTFAIVAQPWRIHNASMLSRPSTCQQ
jgi:hypothetical protein